MKLKNLPIVLSITCMLVAFSGCELLFGPEFIGDWRVELEDEYIGPIRIDLSFERAGSFEMTWSIYPEGSTTFVKSLGNRGTWVEGTADGTIEWTITEKDDIDDIYLVWENVPAADQETQTVTWVVDGDTMTVTIEDLQPLIYTKL